MVNCCPALAATPHLPLLKNKKRGGGEASRRRTSASSSGGKNKKTSRGRERNKKKRAEKSGDTFSPPPHPHPHLTSLFFPLRTMDASFLLFFFFFIGRRDDHLYFALGKSLAPSHLPNVSLLLRDGAVVFVVFRCLRCGTVKEGGEK
jgi:hypothetical protein